MRLSGSDCNETCVAERNERGGGMMVDDECIERQKTGMSVKVVEKIL